MLNRVYRGVIVLCWVAGAILVVVNVRLRSGNLDLSTRMEGYVRLLSLEAGMELEPLHGLDRSGREMFVDTAADTGPVLVLSFAPTCQYCAENWPNWDALLSSQHARNGETVLVDVSGEVGDDYLREHDVGTLPVLSKLSIRTVATYRLGVTPQTVILNDGMVQGSWTGVMTATDVARADSILRGLVAVRPRLSAAQ